MTLRCGGAERFTDLSVYSQPRPTFPLEDGFGFCGTTVMVVPGLAGRELGPSSRASYNRRVGKTLQDNFPNGVNQRCDSGGGSAWSRRGFASLFVMVALGTTINAFQEPYPRPFLVERVLCSWIDSRLHSAGVRIASRPMIRTMFPSGHTRV